MRGFESCNTNFLKKDKVKGLKFYLKTYGCQMNVYDSSRIANIMHSNGFEKASEQFLANVFIFNTCNVREKAVDKLYSEIGRIKNFNKDAIIVVLGCISQAEGHEVFSRAKNVSVVLGSQSSHKICKYIDKFLNTGERQIDLDFAVEDKFNNFEYFFSSESSEISALLTIQEGCDKFCSFCCVPYTRGKQYYRPADDVLQEAEKLASKGAKEITVLGQNVNAYVGDLKGERLHFGALLLKIAGIKGIERIRYLSPHPIDIEESLYDAHKNNKIMPVVHLPIQTGSDKLLKIMNRKHDVEYYMRIVENFKKACPYIEFTSDFIVGHPGETCEDFKLTLELIKEVGYINSFCFKYSPRFGTPAAFLEEKIGVDEEIKQKRLLELQFCVGALKRKFNDSHVNKRVRVLFDKINYEEDNLCKVTGRTEFMQLAHLSIIDRDYASSLYGQTKEAVVTSSFENSLSVKL